MLDKFLICFILTASCRINAFPEDIKRCKVEDDECITKVADEIFQRSFNGIDSLSLPSFDPLKIMSMDIVQGSNETVQIDLKFRNVELLGLSNARVYKVSGFKRDPHKNKVEFHFKTPLASLVGPYSVNGKILFLPIYGDGKVLLNLVNLDVHLKYLTKKVMRDGKVFMELEKAKFSYDVTGANVNFSNLFNGNSLLGSNMNFFLNRNWKLLLDELHRPITASFAKVFREAMNSVFIATPYDELFLN